MDALERNVRDLLNADLSTRTVEDLVVELRPLTAGLSVRAPRIPPGERLFRGRIADHAVKVSELSYPPSSLANLGRANVAGEPMFYSSSARPSAIFETQPRVGDTVLVSWWKTTAVLMVTHIGYHDEVFEKLGSARDRSVWHHLHAEGHPDHQQQTAWRLLAELFTDTTSPNRYLLSAAVTRCVLGDPFDGIMYPSIAMWANGDNIAIRPGWADRRLRFVIVEKLRVKALSDRSFEVDHLDCATSPDGFQLDWKGRDMHWTSEDPLAVLDVREANGAILVTDADGIEVDPS